MDNTLKRIPIGIDNFKELITEDYYYIDKTKLIEELLGFGSKATLITRPRRFGKTLNISMLKYFFEDERDLKGNKINNSYLFKGLYIGNSKYMNEQGRYPVIALSFKECKKDTWEETYTKIVGEIGKEYRRHKYILNNEDLDEDDTELFKLILKGKAKPNDYEESIHFLSRLLNEYYNLSCIILLDEYDVVLQNAYVKGFYKEACNFISTFFGTSFKQNDYMKRAIITGCLRISKESIFTGWNNVDVQTMIGNLYLSSTGITIEEKDKLLEYYGLQNEDELIRKWYDGYNFNGIEIYNPWDLLNYVRNKISNPCSEPESYWIGTSGNDILKEMLEDKNDEIQNSIKRLIQGKEIKKSINEQLTYGYLKAEPHNIWSILLFTGYLTGTRDKQTGLYKLRIPNKSIKKCYIVQVEEYNKRQMRPTLPSELKKHMINNDGIKVEELLNEYLNSVLSYYDDIEGYYHGLITGICSNISDYDEESNKEAGKGRADLILKPSDDYTLPGIILEFKWVKDASNLEKSAEKALKQIEEKKYHNVFGLKMKNIRKFGIAFSGKECRVAYVGKEKDKNNDK